MHNTFLFSQGKTTFSGEKRGVFAVIDGGGEYVRDGEGKEVLSSGETRDSLATRIETEDIEKRTNALHNQYQEVSSEQKEIAKKTHGYRVARAQMQAHVIYSLEGLQEEHREYLLDLVEKNATYGLTEKKRKPLAEYKTWYESEKANNPDFKAYPVPAFTEAFEDFLEGKEVSYSKQEQERAPKEAENMLTKVEDNLKDAPENVQKVGYGMIEKHRRGEEVTATDFHKEANVIAKQKRNELISSSISLTQRASDPIKLAVQKEKNKMLSGHHKDPRVQEIALIAQNPSILQEYSPTRQKEVLQMMQNVLDAPDKTRFSQKELSEQMKNWDKRGNRLKEKGEEGRRKIYYNERFGDNKQLLEQIALYEIAEYTKAQIPQETWNAHQPLEGKGLEVEVEKLINGEYDYTRPYTAANNLMDKNNPKNLLIAYGLKYAGLLTVIFNLIAFVQSGGDNTQALAYAAAGAGAVYGGVQVVKRNVLDSWLHPENKAFNELAPKASGAEKFLLDEFSDNIEFYNLIDFEDKNKKKLFVDFSSDQKRKESKDLGKYSKEKKKKNTKFKSPEWFGRVGENDFQEGGKLTGILRDGAKGNTALLNQDESVTERMKRFRAIQWLYSSGIKNHQLHALQAHAKGLRATNPGKLTQVEKMQGMSNRYYPGISSNPNFHTINERMEKYIAEGSKLS